ncbi:MAG TPA: hypothetical protein ENJ53_00765, partial [Phaeodactylibacter sp.]|nr:hypothetical protein [Phaeodactylibacter sp.]
MSFSKLYFMKKLPIYFVIFFLLVTLFTFCANKNTKLTNMNTHDYAAEWKVIDSLDQQGLPKSALEKVEALYSKVVQKKDQPQIAKCLMYKGKYMTQLEDDGFVKALHQLVSEEKSAKSPMKSLLQSMLGEQYSNYLQRNYYRFSNRTETPDFKTDDIRTWSVGQLSEESRKYFLESVKDKSIKNINIKDWDAILSKGKNTEQLRPTFYDFIAHRALDFLMNETSYLTEPVYKFYIEDNEALADAKTFVAHQFTTKEVTSSKYQTILLFQEITAQHLNDAQPDALIDVDLKRLRFVRQNGVMEEKDERYLKALEQLEKKYSSFEASTDVMYWMARYYLDKGNNYQPNPENTGKFDLKTAYDICQKAMDRARGSYGAQQCANLQAQILSKNLRVEMEQVNLPNEPMLASIFHKNVKKLYAKVIKISERERREMDGIEDRYKNFLPFLNNLKSIKEWTIDLPQEGDYRDHRVEVKVDALPVGYYVVMMADNADFSSQGKAVSYLFTHVSNISYWTRRNEKNDSEFFVVHRKTGEPLKGVRANYFYRDYNSRTRKYEYNDKGEGYTDADGYLKPKVADRQNFQIRWVYQDDVLNLDDSYSNYHYERGNNQNNQTLFFLDRAIYRPGQTVYFKAMLVHYDQERMPTLLKNKNVTIAFLDANYQEVESLKLRTNEYGTVNGKFRAPKSGMLGQMHLQSSENGNKYFRVEEYKRPKFEVKFDPVKESYKIGDDVKVEGLAKAYAGSNVDGAKVRYRVARETIYPYYWGYWRGYYPPSDNMEITNGETTTDKDGKFNITFTAVPDRSADTKNKPQFNYRVYADVIDITGETHSSETNVSVGYIALSINIAVPPQLDRDSLGKKEFTITSQNLNGEFENAQGEITVHQLKSPSKILRQKYWQKPDQYLMTKEEFSRNFPLDIYKNEDEIENWEVGKEVLKTRFDVSRNAKIVVGNKNWKIGGYVLTLNTQDKYGEKIELKKYFTLYDLGDKKLPVNMALLTELDQSKYEPGEVAKYFVASAYPSIKVLQEVEFKNKIIERNWLTVNGLKNLNWNVLEKHRGNVGYHISFVKNNRDYRISQMINVPWSNKDLKLEYSTFRDKLKPGQEEEWRIKITGNKKEKVAAEMVAAMYDASLDEFAANYWNMNLFPMQYISKHLRSNNFASVGSQLMARNWQPQGGGGSRAYRTLKWFGFSSNRYRKSRMYKNEGAVMSSAPPRSFDVEAEPIMEEMLKEDSAVAFGNEGETKKKLMQGTIADSDDGEADKKDNRANKETDGDKKADFSKVKVRTNLNETVFFMPKLMTDENGDVIIKFTMNEALTRWKFLGMAHTKDLKFGITQKEIVTQKELMVLPNPPRFFREGDEIEYTAKVSNLTKKDLSGSAKLELFDALTMQSVDGLLGNNNSTITFEAGAGQSARLAWKLKIPKGKVMAITHRVVAQAGDFSDGEESSLPVLTNRMLVTETMPLPVRGNQTKNFSFDRLKNANSSTLQHHEFTLEFTSNPAWYAVQALPYLMEYPYDCTEQIFSRYYANSLATNVANSHPKVKAVFERWKNTDAMLSNLSKNQELKSALLEETPWVLAAQNEETQKKNIGLLFDLTRMSEERADAIAKITERQLGNGGFSWFPGGRDSRYITQYLVEGMGHLQALGVNDMSNDSKVIQMINRAVVYLDARIAEQYKELLRQVQEGKTKLEDDHLDNLAIHYLYARSFFKNQKIDKNARTAYDYYLGQAEKYWLNKGMYQEGMIALALHREGKKVFTQKIVKSLKERALHNDEMGMYWKYDRGYYWYQLPIETHALMIEVFDEVANDAQAVDDLKVWLLKNKQTTNWKTTKATAAAVYALLRRGGNWLLEDKPVQITLGNKKIDPSKMDTEAGTGYFKTKWKGEDITASMANISVKNPNSVVAWGAVYWQYFEDLDKVTTFEDTPLKLSKKLFKVENSDRGPVMHELKEGNQLSPGDKVQVRIELRVDRPMEYVHMKDMRASGFEPLN